MANGERRQGKQPDQRSIIERIKSVSNEGVLGVSMQELENEFTRLAEIGNPQPMRNLFDVYLTSEMQRRLKPGERPDDIRKRALRNFDFVAKVADAKLIRENRISALSLATDETIPQSVGRVRQFYRNAVNYHPPAPTPKAPLK